MITPQTNTTLPDVARELLARDNFVICGHVSPDGDCLGSQLALAHALRACGKQVACVLAQDEPIDAGLSFLPGAHDLVAASTWDGPAEVFVAVDVPTRDRLGDATALLDRCGFSITIDHHAVLQTMSSLAYVDPDAAATAMLVWELVGLLGAPVSAAVATCAFTGLETDTGRFQYQNTDAAAFSAAASMIAAGADAAEVARNVYQQRSLASLRLEALAIERLRLSSGGRVAATWLSRSDFEHCQAVKADAEPLIDVLRSLAGVQIACVLREQEAVVRGSLRAKGDVDVAALARTFGGGGHKAAAGFTIDGSLERAKERVLPLLDGVFLEGGAKGGARA